VALSQYVLQVALTLRGTVQGPLFDMPGVHVDGMDVLKVRGARLRMGFMHMLLSGALLVLLACALHKHACTESTADEQMCVRG